MVICPKCNYGVIRGPIYQKQFGDNECLEYTCARCGYTSQEHCADTELFTTSETTKAGE